MEETGTARRGMKAARAGGRIHDVLVMHAQRHAPALFLAARLGGECDLVEASHPRRFQHIDD